MMIFQAFVIIFLSDSILSQTPTAPVITGNGPVIGIVVTVSNQNINQFFGIPYAKPPLGNLRFKKPEPVDDWADNYQANSIKPACMQPIWCSSYTNENCLYLNIFTPTLNTSANLSVMFWIHGGNFYCGFGASNTSTGNMFDGSQLALRNVVVVTINYRLGVFGFLYGNSGDAPGNVGLWDQVMALNWTVRNIANFGGNPNDITLFGQSAGSICISDLIVSNPAIGAINWFAKAILLSGSAYNIAVTQPTTYAYSVARSYASNAFLLPWDKCANDNTWIDCLRQKSADSLIIAQINIVSYLKNRFIPELVQFIPIFGDELIPISPNAAVKQGYFRHDLRLLLSHTEMEGQGFAVVYDILRFLSGRYIGAVQRPLIITKGIVRKDLSDILFANTPFRQTVANDYTNVFTELGVVLNPQPIRRSAAFAFGDALIACPTVLFGAYIAKWQSFSGKVFQSRFTHVSAKSSNRGSVWANATHGDDEAFIFGRPVSRASEWNSDDTFLSNKIMDYYTYFAKNGEMATVNPSFGVWPSYTVSSGGDVNASYVELHASHNRLGRVFANTYRGSDGYTPSVIYDCFNYWDALFNSQFN